MKLAISKSKLQAALLFSAKNDIRYYLNGVFLDSSNGNIVATDGHRLIVIDSNWKFEHDVIIPNALIKSAISVLKKDECANINYEQSSNTICITASDGSAFAAPAIDGKYPDYSRCIPSDEVRSPGIFNPQYLADGAKAASLLGERSKDIGLILKTNKPTGLEQMSYHDAVECLSNQSAIYRGKDFIITIMPQRC